MNPKNLTKVGIINSIRSSRGTLLSFGIKKIGLFGSFVRNEASIESDIDLVVDFYPEKRTYDNFFDACVFLEDLLKWKVQLVTSDSLSPYIKPNVLKEVEYVPLSA